MIKVVLLRLHIRCLLIQFINSDTTANIFDQFSVCRVGWTFTLLGWLPIIVIFCVQKCHHEEDYHIFLAGLWPNRNKCFYGQPEWSR